MRLSRPLYHSLTTMKATLRATEKEVTIKAPWGNIAALSWGNPSNPPVVLCHGKLDVCSGFRPLVLRLPDCFFYLSVDLPGNGKSDHLPRGLRYSVIDLVPTIARVKDHFKWEKFIYIGHSLGVPIGKFFNIAYPGHITRTVELDPVPAHHNWPSDRKAIKQWFERYYAIYDHNQYDKINGDIETAPKYTYEKVLEKTMNARRISREPAENVLERCLVPAGDGLFRLTFDQRMKEVTILPFSGEVLREIYSTTTTPTFCVLAQDMIDVGAYKGVEAFLMDESAWPNKNYKVKIVQGGHDVHMEDPDCMAEDISKFLLEDLKAKL